MNEKKTEMSEQEKNGQVKSDDVEVFDEPYNSVRETLRAQENCRELQFPVQKIPQLKGNFHASKSPNKTQGLFDNIIFIGSKPLVNYVRGVIVQFKKHGAKEVVIKSRGKFISKAVDVAEIAKRSLNDINAEVKGISIASESFEAEGKKTNISTMDIVLGTQ